MTRKDYEAVAAILADAQAEGEDIRTLEYVARRLAVFFAADNRAFRPRAFFDAAQVHPSERPTG